MKDERHDEIPEEGKNIEGQGKKRFAVPLGEV